MSRSRWLPAMGLTLITAVALGGASARPAQAATNGIANASVNLEGLDVVTFTAGTGRENKVVISGSGGVVTIDDVFPITPGDSCEQVPDDLTRVRCYVLDPVPDLGVATLGFNDTITNNSPSAMSADGGDGDDTITGSSAADHLVGGAGADRIWGLWGNDRVSGGDGDDRVFGGDGDDTLFGDAGADRVSGGGGDDTLDAGLGRDWLDGGPNRTEAGDLCVGDDTVVRTGCER